MRDGGGRGAALANLVLGSERGRVADEKNRGELPGAKTFDDDNARKQRTMGRTMTDRAATRSHFNIGQHKYGLPQSIKIPQQDITVYSKIAFDLLIMTIIGKMCRLTVPAATAEAAASMGSVRTACVGGHEFGILHPLRPAKRPLFKSFSRFPHFAAFSFLIFFAPVHATSGGGTPSAPSDGDCWMTLQATGDRAVQAEGAGLMMGSVHVG